MTPESLTLAFGLNNITVLANPILAKILQTQTRKIKKVYTYDAYAYPAAKDDIAVVELSKPVELGRKLKIHEQFALNF